MNQNNQELTRAELEVMTIVWEKGEAFLSDIYDAFPEGDNRPAYTTISTFVRILQRKGYLGYTVHGKSHKYYPLVGKESYASSMMKGVVRTFFDNSPSLLLSFFTKKENLTASQYEELVQLAQKIVDENEGK